MCPQCFGQKKENISFLSENCCFLNLTITIEVLVYCIGLVMSALCKLLCNIYIDF